MALTDGFQLTYLSLNSFNQDLKNCRGIEAVVQIKNIFTR